MSTKNKLAELILTAMNAETAGSLADAQAASCLADGMALFAQLVGEAVARPVNCVQGTALEAIADRSKAITAAIAESGCRQVAMLDRLDRAYAKAEEHTALQLAAASGAFPELLVRVIDRESERGNDAAAQAACKAAAAFRTGMAEINGPAADVSLLIEAIERIAARCQADEMRLAVDKITPILQRLIVLTSRPA